MLKIIPYLALVAFCMLPQLGRGSDEILYWMVEEDAKVHYQDGTSQMMPMLVPSSESVTLAARVRVSSASLAEDTFLDLYYQEEDGSWAKWPGDLGIDFGDSGSGYWGCGVPTGNFSPITEFGSPEFSFIMEIGNYNWDDDSWTTVASSASQSYNSLVDKGYIHYTFDLNPPSGSVWSPKDFYAPIPEPSTGLLMLIGGTLLMLRRKHGLG